MLYIIRHGKTDWNAEHRMQGRTNIPLNEEGKKMAECAGQRYADIDFDVCYCSPLVRAKETAELMLDGRDIPIIFDDRLMEMCFGEAEGEFADLDNPKSPVYNFFRHPELYTEIPNGAESFDELFARTGEFLNEVVFPQVAEGKNVLIVGHGAMNSSIVCHVLDLPIEEFWSVGIENCVLKQLFPSESFDTER